MVSLAQSAWRANMREQHAKTGSAGPVCFIRIVMETTEANLLTWWPHASIWFATTCVAPSSSPATLKASEPPMGRLRDFVEICSTKMDPSVVNARQVYRMIKGAWPPSTSYAAAALVKFRTSKRHRHLWASRTLPCAYSPHEASHHFAL